MVLLTTTGARTGQPRTVPVLGRATADGFAVIASNFGQRRHPGWYHNLRASPGGSVAVAERSRRVRAIKAEGDRRRRCRNASAAVEFNKHGWAMPLCG